MRRRARGQQGSWFAEVEGECYPCVHERFLTGLNYMDPAEGVPLPHAYVEAIERGTIILTKSEQTPEGDYRRTGYIALYRIEDFSFQNGQLSFCLADRLTHLK